METTHPVICLLIGSILILMMISYAVSASPTTHPAQLIPPLPPEDQLLKTLRKDHPRLIVTRDDLEKLATNYRTKKNFRIVADKLLKDADQIVAAQPSEYEIPDGKRLLQTSRRVLDRVQKLAVAYHLTGDKKYLDRCWAELDAARQFKDWNPSHFLDTAEMTTAFALGYDWLFNQWTPTQRQQLREAIITHGLKPGLAAYERQDWWTKVIHNWNQVCNGGLMTGALAIAEDEPQLSSRIVREALERLPQAIQHFAPDGAWNEGPGYWAYAMRYTARPIAGIQTAMGTDYGLSNVIGLSEAGQFALHIVGPSGKSFNFADGGSDWDGTPDLWWLAKRYNQPAFALAQRPHAMQKPQALDLVWGEFDRNDPPVHTPTDRYFRDAEFVTFRTAWNDPDALFVGFKSGANDVNHSNLDLGSIVLDTHGQRFVLDLGPDNYNLPLYFGANRWTYYRLRAEGHNTLVIGPNDQPDQNPKAKTRINRFETNAARSFAITDLTDAYANAKQVVRGVALDKKNRAVVIQDEITNPAPTDVWWFIHTPAEIVLSDDARSATFTLKGKSIRARLISPQHATFTIRDALPLPTSPNPQGQRENKGITKLAIHLKQVESTRINVVIETAGPSKTLFGEGQELNNWK